MAGARTQVYRLRVDLHYANSVSVKAFITACKQGSDALHNISESSLGVHIAANGQRPERQVIAQICVSSIEVRLWNNTAEVRVAAADGVSFVRLERGEGLEVRFGDFISINNTLLEFRLPGDQRQLRAPESRLDPRNRRLFTADMEDDTGEVISALETSRQYQAVPVPATSSAIITTIKSSPETATVPRRSVESTAESIGSDGKTHDPGASQQIPAVSASPPRSPQFPAAQSTTLTAPDNVTGQTVSLPVISPRAAATNQSPQLASPEHTADDDQRRVSAMTETTVAMSVPPLSPGGFADQVAAVESQESVSIIPLRSPFRPKLLSKNTGKDQLAAAAVADATGGHVVAFTTMDSQDVATTISGAVAFPDSPQIWAIDELLDDQADDTHDHRVNKKSGPKHEPIAKAATQYHTGSNVSQALDTLVKHESGPHKRGNQKDSRDLIRQTDTRNSSSKPPTAQTSLLSVGSRNISLAESSAVKRTNHKSVARHSNVDKLMENDESVGVDEFLETEEHTGDTDLDDPPHDNDHVHRKARKIERPRSSSTYSKSSTHDTTEAMPIASGITLSASAKTTRGRGSKSKVTKARKSNSSVTDASTARQKSASPNESAQEAQTRHNRRGNIRVIFADNTTIAQKMNPSFCKKLGISVVYDVSSCDVFCARSGADFKRTIRSLYAITLGKLIVRDDWLESAQVCSTLGAPEDYLVESSDVKKEFDTTVAEAANCFRSSSKPLSGYRIRISDKLANGIGARMSDFRGLIEGLGASNLTVGLPKRTLGTETVCIGIDDSKDRKDATVWNFNLYSKDVLAFVVFVGRLPDNDSQFLLISVQERKERERKRGRAPTSGRDEEDESVHEDGHPPKRTRN